MNFVNVDEEMITFFESHTIRKFDVFDKIMSGRENAFVPHDFIEQIFKKVKVVHWLKSKFVDEIVFCLLKDWHGFVKHAFKVLWAFRQVVNNIASRRLSS